jgi:sn-glycerol 3-phosphate transport system ATP-binding protein
MARIDLEQLRKVYPGGVEAVKGIDLAIRDGELVVLVGPSGCGKSTLLRMVAGLETITAGRWSTRWSPPSATSPWSSRTTRSIRT